MIDEYETNWNAPAASAALGVVLSAIEVAVTIAAAMWPARNLSPKSPSAPAAPGLGTHPSVANPGFCRLCTHFDHFSVRFAVICLCGAKYHYWDVWDIRAGAHRSGRVRSAHIGARGAYGVYGAYGQRLRRPRVPLVSG